MGHKNVSCHNSYVISYLSLFHNGILTKNALKYTGLEINLNKFLGAIAFMLGKGCRPLFIHGHPQDFLEVGKLRVWGLGTKVLQRGPGM